MMKVIVSTSQRQPLHHEHKVDALKLTQSEMIGLVDLLYCPFTTTESARCIKPHYNSIPIMIRLVAGVAGGRRTKGKHKCFLGKGIRSACCLDQPR